MDKIIHALSLAQANYHAATFLAVPETADLVARENQGDTHVTGGYFSSARNAAQLAEWQQYTITLDPQQGGIDVRDRFAEVTTDGKTLDGFIRTAPRRAACRPATSRSMTAPTGPVAGVRPLRASSPILRTRVAPSCA